MANNLFDYKDVRNTPSRNGFDLGNKLCTTAKAGELRPLYWNWVNPGDTFRYGSTHVTRTRPINTSAFVRIKEYFDWFFVPLNLLWKSFPTMITKMDNNPVQALSMESNVNPTEDTPYLMLSDLVSYIPTGSNNPNEVFCTNNLKNQFGFERSYLWAKLASDFGYFRMTDALVDKYKTLGGSKFSPIYTDYPVTIFPIAAYHKIYNDYYRFEQWEKSSPFLWNFDYSQGGKLTVPSQGSSDGYWNGFTLFDMHYANWNKDLFMGLMPNQQYGEAAAIDALLTGNVVGRTPGVSTQQNLANSSLTIVGTERGNQIGTNFTATTDGAAQPVSVDIRANFGGQIKTNVPLQVVGDVYTSPQTVTLASNAAATFSVIALRQAEALQRWKEISQSGDQTYRDQIFKHFGISLPEELSDMCEFIGGNDSMINISEVVNQNLATDAEGNSYNADIKGKGFGTGDYTNERTFNRHGIIMCVYHAQPLLDYDLPALDFRLAKTNYCDFFIPEFDRIGMEELPSCYLLNGITEFSKQATEREPFTLGYSPRYYEYKTSIDRVTGAFRDTLSSWVAPINAEYLTSAASSALVDITYQFFKVNPLILDNIFAGTIQVGDTLDSSCASDQLWLNVFFDVKAVRGMDYDGVPY